MDLMDPNAHDASGPSRWPNTRTMACTSARSPAMVAVPCASMSCTVFLGNTRHGIGPAQGQFLPFYSRREYTQSSSVTGGSDAFDHGIDAVSVSFSVLRDVSAPYNPPLP